MSRRRFIAGAAGALAVGAVGPGVLGALDTGADARSGQASATATAESRAAALRVLGRTGLRVPGSRAYPNLAAGIDTLPGIDHVVVLMMENHSYDDMFGMLRRGDGYTLDAKGRPTASNPYPDGSIQHAFHMPTTCQLPGTPSQEWLASHNAYNNGANDGFVSTPISSGTSEIVGGVAMGYWTGDDLPFTYSLASKFPIGDRFFCSLLGQTDPNRRYLIAGTSAGMTDDIGEGLGNALPDASLPLPANGTIFNQLDLHGISWTNYVTSYPLGATPNLFPTTDAVTEILHYKPFDAVLRRRRGRRPPSLHPPR
jgi:phospholipase C